MADDQARPHGVDRRTVIRRAGLVAGGTLWATPVVQSIAAPAFATGTPLALPGFSACVVGDGRIVGGAVTTGRLSTPLSHVTFRIVESLCCDHPSAEIRVTSTPANPQASSQDFVFDSNVATTCNPQLDCASCPTVVTGFISGRAEPQDTGAVLTFRFERIAPTPGDRGGRVDFVRLTIETNDYVLTVEGSPQPNPDVVEIECDSC